LIRTSTEGVIKEELADRNKSALLKDQTLVLCPSGHSEDSASLDNFANTLLVRFQRLGQVTDLDQAVLLHEQVLELRPSDHPDRSALLNNLASVL
jgi:hypothetical protein